MSFTKSYWHDTSKFPAFSQLKENIKSDVCIIGAGITGLTAAYLLQKKGKSVCVIDKNETVGGSQTQRTSGHLCWTLDDRFHHLKYLFGDDTKLVIESHMAAIKLIETIVKEENIECDFKRVPGYLFLDVNDDESTLKKELDALNSLGINDVKLLSNVPVDSFNSGLCLQFPDQAEFHVGKYLAALAHILEERGVKIFTETHYKGLSTNDDQNHIVETNLGFNIQSESVIFATNTPINDWIVMHTKQGAYRTYIVAGEVPKDSFPQILMWDTGDPYHYFRVVKDYSKDKDLLLIGGEDHKTGQCDDTEGVFQKLENWIKLRIVDFKSVYHWSGQVLEPVDSLAYIGRNPLDKPNVYIATGDSGNGLTHGTIAGILITDLIMKVNNPWENIYRPNRKTLKSAGEYAEENLNVAGEYLKELIPNEIYSEDAIDKIPKDSGKVLQKGLHKRCVYKDKKGVLHECTAICPHLQGEVKWNDAEKTWDCPCHGSRFDFDGKVIDGPAYTDLK